MRIRTPKTAVLATLFVAGAALAAAGAAPHITPAVVLMSDREAIRGALDGSDRYFVREVRLTDAERAHLEEKLDWKPEEDFYRFFLGRDDAGDLVAAAVFLTETTIHGPVRVMVSLGPDGTIRQARVVEMTEETYAWVKPILDEDLTDDYVGYTAESRFELTERFEEMSLAKMPKFYAEIIIDLVARGTALYDLTFLQRGTAG